MAANKLESTLQEALKNAIVKAGLSDDIEASKINIEIPKDKSHGDYSSNIAMQLTRVLHRNPREIAQQIADALDKEAGSIDQVEIAGPGFLNFFMKNDALTSIIKEVLTEKENYGASDFGKGIKYDVEFVSANPTGDLHLGHAKGAAVGDSIVRIMRKAGYDVTAEYYINDAGNQITNLALSLYTRYLALFGIEREMPKDGYYGQDVKDIAAKVKEEHGDEFLHIDEEEAIHFFRKLGTEHELQKIKDILNEFRVHFDYWFSETSLYRENMIQPVIDALDAKGYLYKEDGALWFRSTDFDDDKDRVLIKKDGSYTYFTPDIAYHKNKFDRGFDYLVDLFGADHHGYINRMKAAMQALGYNKDQLNIDIMQLVQMVENGEVVKMSKRTGNAVTIKGTDGTVYVQGTSSYTITVSSYSTTVDMSGAISGVSYDDYKVAAPSQLASVTTTAVSTASASGSATASSSTETASTKDSVSAKTIIVIAAVAAAAGLAVYAVMHSRKNKS